MHVISARELRDAVTAPDLVEPMREAFVGLSQGRFRATFSLLDLDHGDVHVKAASERGGEVYVVKLASWVAPATTSGAILVCSAATGAPLALLVDEHHLTDVRTAAAGALATQLLAPASASSVCLIGAGEQARLQALTLAALRPIERLTVWARRPAAVASLVSDLAARLPETEVRAAADACSAVEQSEIVITATASTEPIVEDSWLRAGHHVTALGADDADKRELAVGCFARADRVVVDSRAQTCGLAELPAALASGAVRERDLAELGELLSGAVEGRAHEDQITIAKLTGVAAQDLVAVRVALDRLEIAA